MAISRLTFEDDLTSGSGITINDAFVLDESNVTIIGPTRDLVRRYGAGAPQTLIGSAALGAKFAFSSSGIYEILFPAGFRKISFFFNSTSNITVTLFDANNNIPIGGNPGSIVGPGLVPYDDTRRTWWDFAVDLPETSSVAVKAILEGVSGDFVIDNVTIGAIDALNEEAPPEPETTEDGFDIYYVDPVGGNDSGNALTYATRVQNFSALPVTAAGKAEIRYPESPTSYLGLSATFTFDSDTVQVTNPPWKVIHNCDNGWTLSTAASTGGYGYIQNQIMQHALMGTYIQKAGTNPGNGGCVAYATLASLDLSAFNTISYWAKGSYPNFKLCLCSDQFGENILVETPLGCSFRDFQRYTFTHSGNLPSNVQSVAIHWDGTPNTFGLCVVSNIVACNNSNTTTGVDHTCLIQGSSSGSYDPNEPMYAIMALYDTSLVLMSLNILNSTQYKMRYQGTSGVKNLIKSRPFRQTRPAMLGSHYIELTTRVSNVRGETFRISGGWSHSSQMSTRTGISWFTQNDASGVVNTNHNPKLISPVSLEGARFNLCVRNFGLAHWNNGGLPSNFIDTVELCNNRAAAVYQPDSEDFGSYTEHVQQVCCVYKHIVGCYEIGFGGQLPVTFKADRLYGPFGQNNNPLDGIFYRNGARDFKIFVREVGNCGSLFKQPNTPSAVYGTTEVYDLQTGSLEQLSGNNVDYINVSDAIWTKVEASLYSFIGKVTRTDNSVLKSVYIDQGGASSNISANHKSDFIVRADNVSVPSGEDFSFKISRVYAPSEYQPNLFPLGLISVKSGANTLSIAIAGNYNGTGISDIRGGLVIGDAHIKSDRVNSRSVFNNAGNSWSTHTFVFGETVEAVVPVYAYFYRAAHSVRPYSQNPVWIGALQINYD